MDQYGAQVFYRWVHGLSPDGRMFVGGDTDDERETLSANTLPLMGVVAGGESEEIQAYSRSEIVRADTGGFDDFRLFFEALAEGQTGSAEELDRSALPTAYLAEGSGNFYARTRFSGDAIWLVSQCKGIAVDHQHHDAGNFTLSRGPDALVVDPTPYGSLSTLTGNAPTLSQPHFAPEYQPSQGAFGEEYSEAPVPETERTRFVFARATASRVAATRCDWDGQLRFRDEPSAGVANALRDTILLPGDSGASVVIVDRIQTTDSWAEGNPLELRFRSIAPFSNEPEMGGAQAVVGGSRLLVRRLLGEANTQASANLLGSCGDTDRGKCRDARFASSEWQVQAGGPQPELWHLLDADAEDASPSVALLETEEGYRRLSVERERRRYLVVSREGAAANFEYSAARAAATHVVLDPPPGERVQVLAEIAEGGQHCSFSLAASEDGFLSQPLIFNVHEDCTVSEDTAQETELPGSADGSGGALGGPPGSAAGAGNEAPSGLSAQGCSCEQAPAAPTGPLVAWLFALLPLRSYLRRAHRTCG